MATLTYWTAHCMTDANCYSIIAKTRKEVAAQIAALDLVPNENGDFCKIYSDGTLHEMAEYGAIEKRTIHYRDAFDLFDIATSEGGGR
jgi:hypothetical protein